MNITLRLSIPVLFFSLCLSYPLYAQREGLVPRRYLMQDGLSHDYAASILQDSQGFLWIGTGSV